MTNTPIALKRRQNPLLDEASKFDQAIAAVEKTFGGGWLAKGDTPLHQLWRRTDWLASGQLYLLGAGIVRMADHPAFIKEQVAAIRSEENRRRGAMFELVGVPFFAGQAGVVSPTKRHARGYDAVVDFEGAGQLHLSLKNFAVTHKEREFLSAAARLESRFLDGLKKWKQRALGLVALSETFATPQAWSELSEAVDHLIAKGPGGIDRIGPWSVLVHDLPPEYGPYSERLPSWQLVVHAGHAPNERQTVVDKLSGGASNARKHASQDAGVARALFVRLHENADLESFATWASEAIQDTDRGPLEAMILYQPGLVDVTASNERAISHTFAFAHNSAFSAWRAGSAQRTPSLSPAIGLVSHEPAQRRIVSDKGEISLRGGYFHQSGRYRAVLPFGEGEFHLPSPAAGIVREVFLQDAAGGFGIAPIIPPDGRLTLFD
ncbi:hypothetical protein [Brevundimonas sp.]|uniref:hypothetical protein n=1 Tax=Brevundimonas sp. TaxID=1871086 RepID=UPI001A313140|nr:hypothetical protein [Brevundimonas sp.]MBJ7484189.1 hypothetical protein [Brevundimonas sp.]